MSYQHVLLVTDLLSDADKVALKPSVSSQALLKPDCPSCI